MMTTQAGAGHWAEDVSQTCWAVLGHAAEPLTTLQPGFLGHHSYTRCAAQAPCPACSRHCDSCRQLGQTHCSRFWLCVRRVAAVPLQQHRQDQAPAAS